MNVDIFDLSIFLFIAAVIAFGILTLGIQIGVRYGRVKERTIAQAAMINAMRNIEQLELTEEDSREIAVKLRRKMKEADEAWIPGEMDV